MHIRFLETVVWLSEIKNFRVTAERMNMTPAAISSRIAAMEQELGIRLFDRDTRDVRLTPEGTVFVEGARDILARYNRLIATISPATSAEGTVRIGLLPSMALTILPGIMEVLKQRFPRVRVTITTDTSNTLLDRMDNREIDIILGFPGPRPDHVASVHLCSLGMFWIAEGSMVAEDDVLTTADILNHPIISYEVGTYNHQRLIGYLPDISLPESVIHYSNSLGTTISMVMAGVGVTVLPPVVIQNELRSGALRVMNVRPPFPATDYYAVFLKNPPSRLSPLIASIAFDVAGRFCALFDDTLACQQSDGPVPTVNPV